MSRQPAATDFVQEGFIKLENSQWEEALAYFDCAPQGLQAAEVANGRARALEGIGRCDEALKWIDHALAINPFNAADLRNRGILLARAGRKADALASYDEALAAKPDQVDVLIKRALILIEQDRREDALASVNKALEIAPGQFDAVNAKLIVLDQLGQYEAALTCADQLLATSPSNVDAINNTGMILARMGRFAESLRCYDRSLAIDPAQRQAQYNRALIRLSLGDWIRGFQEFECRWNTDPLKLSRIEELGPLWLGQEDLRGKTLFLHHEQGYGDTLQCLRYVPLLAQRGAKLILAVPQALRSLASTLEGLEQVTCSGEIVPRHDLQCPLMSLLLASRTTPDTIPTGVPYLHADRACRDEWSRRIGPHNKWRIGLVWSGRRYPPLNYPRDLSLAQLEPLLTLDAQFFCLQTEISDHDRRVLESRADRFFPPCAFSSFSDTAALIENLDLVIAVDTAVAHLAGALGKPIWLLNRYAACWRWQPPSAASAWYPTMKEYRQKKWGDWESVLANVFQALSAHLCQVPPSPHRSARVEKPAAAAMDPIRLVCATRLSRDTFFSSAPLGRSLPTFRKFPVDQRIELRLFAENTASLSMVYNTAIEESRSRPAILIFIHDDVYLSDYFWTTHLRAALSHFDLVGIVGNRRRVPRQASWMYLDGYFTRDDDAHLSGVIGHGNPFPDLRQLSVYGAPGQEVKLLDGVFLATRSTLLVERELRFDPQFAFHFYDLDFCRQAELRGVRMGTWPMSIVHASAGQLGGDAWRAAYDKYLQKYQEA
jgi:tetratricopeptide (TPR) repeat protein